MFMKNIKISDICHTKIKIYCAINGLKISQWIEEEIIKIIESKNVDIRYNNNKCK